MVTSIQYVLQDMENTNDGNAKVFSIEFIRATGKNKGSRKRVKRAVKLSHASGHNHLEAGTIPLYDLDSRHNFTPCIHNILFYNGIKIKH